MNFGAGSTAFGGNKQNIMFGQSATANTFGAPSGFGQRPSTTPAFGTGLMTPTGQGSAPAFGAPIMGGGGAPSSPFSSGFRSAQQPQTTTLGGGGGGFGQPSVPGGFGSTPPGTGAFGAMQRAGSPAPLGGGLSGLGGGFGSTTSAFGANKPATSPFGGVGTGFGGVPAPTTTFGGIGGQTGFGQVQHPQQTTGFGFSSQMSGGGFGQQAAAAAAPGTGNPPFAAIPVVESSVQDGRTTKITHYLNVISAMPAYEGKSQEELRLEDYQRGNRTPGVGGAGIGMGGAFGQQAKPAGYGGFGAASTQFGAQPSPAFGATQPTGLGGFGATTTGFGATSTPFGATTAPTFGAAQTPAFGAAQTPAFGAATTPAFGTSQPSGFGAAPAPGFGAAGGGFGSTGFGAPSGGFGQTSAPAFGQTATPAFGSFGQTSTPAFGTAPTPGFGASAAPAFGQTAPAFGTAQQATTGFGQQPSSVGFGTGSAFGQQPAAQGGFGQSSAPAFGSTTPSAPFGQSTSGFGGGGMFGQQPTSSATTGFGTSTAGGFGQSGFSQPAASGFGSSTTPGFGQTGATAGFGQTGATGFGQTGTSAFGQPASGFGAKPGGFGSPAASSGFGQPSSSFGTQPASGGFGQPASTGFGQLGGFGSSGFGAAPSTGGFGQTGLGGFGSTTTAFGQPSAGAFGMAQPQQQQQQQQLPGFGGGSTQQLLSAHDDNLYSSLGRKLELLRRKKDTLEINLKGRSESSAQAGKDSSSGGGVGGARSDSLPAASSTPGGGGSVASMIYNRHTPISSARITPRGFLAKESPAAKTSSVVASASATADVRLFSPDNLLNRSAMRLVLDSTRVIQDPTLNLPMPPRSTGPTATPMRSSETVSTGTGNGPDAGAGKGGDKTWLTPGAVESPSVSIHPSANLFSQSSEQKNASVQFPENGSESKPEEPPFSFLRSQERKENDRPTPSMTDRTEVTVPIEAPVSNSAPTLLRKGYGLVPSLAVLQKMTEAELKNVSNFTIFRPNIGEIKWPGETDVRGIDLDTIVRIEQNEVIVYEQVDGVVKPPVGQGLNKRATITLWNVFPKASASYQKQIQFEAKLRKICDDSESDFHYYDCERGEWCFSVDHFSRYGLNDDDSDDEDSELTKKAAPADRLIRPKSFISKYDGRTPKTAPISTQKFDAAAASPIPGNALVMYSGPGTTSATAGTTRTMSGVDEEKSALATRDLTSALSSTMKRRRTTDVVIMDLTRAASRIQVKAMVLPEDSPCMAILMRVKADIFAAKNIKQASWPIYTSMHNTGVSDGIARPMTNISLAMHRSFRVGWSPHGLIVHSGKSVFIQDPQFGVTHRAYIEKVAPLRWAESVKKAHGIIDQTQNGFDDFSAISYSLGAILQASQCTDSAGVPQWSPPSAVSENVDEYLRFASMIKGLQLSFSSAVQAFGPRHPDWIASQCVDLLDACCGQERMPISHDLDNALLPLFEQRRGMAVHLWERRREFLAQWLQRLASFQVKLNDSRLDSGNGTEKETFARIFDLLSCRRIQDAVATAEASGMFRVATLLSQIGGDDNFTLLMDQQLASWKECEADKTMSAEVLSVYRLLAGAALVTYDDDASLLQHISWPQGLGILFWYCQGSVARLGDALAHFKLALAQEQVHSPAVILNGKKQPSFESAIFSLLEVLFESQSLDAVAKVLRPQGLTGDLLDYRHSYNIAVIFECLEISSSTTTSVSIVRQHLISGLITEGQWMWALFLTLQQNGATQREHQTKDLLFRFASQIQPQNVDHFRQFLEQSLHIPQAWVLEALAYACPTTAQKAQYFIEAGCWELANEVVSFELAAQSIFASDTVLAPLEELLSLIESNIDPVNSTWKYTGLLLLEYLRLLSRHSDLVGISKADELELGDMCTSLLADAQRYVVRLESLSLDQYPYKGQGPTLGKAAKHAISSHISSMMDQLENSLTLVSEAVYRDV